MSHNSLRIVGLTALAALAACSAKHPGSTAGSTVDETTQLAQDGSDTSSIESDTETMVTSFVSGSGSNVALASAGELRGSELHLETIGEGTKAYYLPATCMQVTQDDAAKTATYRFNGCTGPFGLAHITGIVTVTYAVSAANVLVLDFAATQLSVNKATVDWSAHAEIAAGRLGARTMTWKGQFSGTTARGRTLSRTNSKVVAWTVGGSCVRVDGTSDGDVTGRALHTDVIGYARCRGECPGAGSEIKITDTKSAKSIDIKYDGTPIATFTDAKGNSTQIALACGL